MNEAIAASLQTANGGAYEPQDAGDEAFGASFGTIAEEDELGPSDSASNVSAPSRH